MKEFTQEKVQRVVQYNMLDVSPSYEYFTRSCRSYLEINRFLFEIE